MSKAHILNFVQGLEAGDSLARHSYSSAYSSCPVVLMERRMDEYAEEYERRSLSFSPLRPRFQRSKGTSRG